MNEVIRALRDRATEARAKHPDNTHKLAALMSEVGELSDALIGGEGRQRVMDEALDVAVVALRIYEQGCGDFAGFGSDWDANDNGIIDDADELAAFAEQAGHASEDRPRHPAGATVARYIAGLETELDTLRAELDSAHRMLEAWENAAHARGDGEPPSREEAEAFFDDRPAAVKSDYAKSREGFEP